MKQQKRRSKVSKIRRKSSKRQRQVGGTDGLDIDLLSSKLRIELDKFKAAQPQSPSSTPSSTPSASTSSTTLSASTSSPQAPSPQTPLPQASSPQASSPYVVNFESPKFNTRQDVQDFLKLRDKVPKKLQEAKLKLDTWMKSDIKKLKIAFIDDNYNDMVNLINKSSLEVNDKFKTMFDFVVRIFTSKKIDLSFDEKVYLNTIVSNMSMFDLNVLLMLVYLVVKDNYAEYDRNFDFKFELVRVGDNNVFLFDKDYKYLFN